LSLKPRSSLAHSSSYLNFEIIMIGIALLSAFSGSARRRQGIHVSDVILLATLLFAQSMVLVSSEIIDLGLNMILDASSDEVHFVRGFLQAPASIDLSNIRWITNEDVVFDLLDDNDNGLFDDDTNAYVEDDEYETSPPSLNEVKTDISLGESSEDSESKYHENEDNPQGEGSKDNFDYDTDITGFETNNEEEEKEDISDPNDYSENEVNSIDGIEGELVSESPKPTTEEELETDSDIDGMSEEEDAELSEGIDIDGEDEEIDSDSNENLVDDEDDEEIDADSNADLSDDEEDEEIDADSNEDLGDEGEIYEEEDSDGMDEEIHEESNAEFDTDEEELDQDLGDDENNDEGLGKEFDNSEDEGKSNEELQNNDEDLRNHGGNQDNEGSTPAASSAHNNGLSNENEGDEAEQDKGYDEGGELGDGFAAEKTTKPSLAPSTMVSGSTVVGGNRNLQNSKHELSVSTNQIADISLFLVPEDCKTDSWGNCDWVALGIGSYDDEMEGGMSYCCSKDTSDRGICNADDIGTMMIHHDIFEGDHRKLYVPSVPLEDFVMDDPLFEVKKSGDYVMVIANCNDDGFGIITLGNMEWKSVGGYLPGDMFGLMFFYGATTVIYLIFGLWYYYGMKFFQEAAIPIQKYILGTIILGFLATAFQGIDLFFWNISGMRSPIAMYIALVLGILFQASLRCLGVMVAMGWGIVRDTLGMVLCKIIMLGLLYFGLTLVRDSLDAAASSAQLVSSTEKKELVNVARVLSFVIICINIIFYCWIIFSLRTTTEYLRNMNQTSKLRRHLRLCCLIVTSLFVSVVLTVFDAVQSLPDFIPQIFNGSDSPFGSILNKDQTWIIKAIGYGNYLFILFGVTILWRPNANAKDYAMQMQLPAHADSENDLELSCVVPSADDVDIGEGYKIDDAVAT